MLNKTKSHDHLPWTKYYHILLQIIATRTQTYAANNKNNDKMQYNLITSLKRKWGRDRELLRNWLTQFWRLASLQSAEQRSQLENQRRVNVATQIQRQSGGRIPFISEGPQSFSYGLQLIQWGLRTLWRVICFNDLNVNLIKKWPYSNILEWCFSKDLDSMT